MATPHAQQQDIKDESQSQRPFDAGITQHRGFSQRSVKHDDDNGSVTESEGSNGLPEMEQQADDDGEDETMDGIEGPPLTDEQLAQEEYERGDRGDWEAEGFRGTSQKGSQTQTPNLDARPQSSGHDKEQDLERSARKAVAIVHDHGDGEPKSADPQPIAANEKHDHGQLATQDPQTSGASAKEPAKAPKEASAEEAANDQQQPDLSQLEWNELHQAFGDQMSEKTREEEELKARFQKLTAVSYALS